LGLVQTCIGQYIEEWNHHPLPYQMIMILLWTKPLHTKLDFGAISQKQQSTEPMSEVRHIILTPSQPVFVLFL
jgi:hypothetical protein